ncbi:MAG TPA: hypothetical protein VKY73_23195 [Polyangiaceae bacterium]|nr:hypothetical protein [Polyangiaceae bacterium]
MKRSELVWCVLLALFVPAACSDDDDDLEVCLPENLECGTGDVRQSEIDTGIPLEADPGEGVGVLVEYLGDGRWHVFTTCDTERSGFECAFDVLVTPLDDAAVVEFEEEDLESSDVLAELGSNGVNLRAFTDYDTDGFFLETEPGVGLSVDTLLDCGCGHPFIFWSGGGAIHSGAPSNPIELIPTEP